MHVRSHKRYARNALLPLVLSTVVAVAIVVVARVVIPPASAANVGIAAIVGGEVILSAEVDDRVRILIGGGAQPSQQVETELRQRTLQTLMQESMQIALARRLRLLPTDDEVTNAVEAFLNTRGVTREALAQIGVGIDAVRSRVEAEIAWARVVQQFYANQQQVSPVEVDRALVRAAERFSSTQYRYGEIVLSYPPDNRSARVRTMALAAEIRRRVARGERFQAFAQQLSSVPSARNGGLVDWKNIDEIDDNIREILTELEPSQLSRPVDLGNAVAVVALIEVQPPLNARQRAQAAQYVLQHVSVSLPPPTAKPDARTESNTQSLGSIDVDRSRNDRIALAHDLHETYISCADGSTRLASLPGVSVRTAPRTVGSDLSADIRDAVIDLEPSDVLELKITDAKAEFYALCSRTPKAGSGLPSREATRVGLESSVLDGLARNLLASLERRTTIQMF